MFTATVNPTANQTPDATQPGTLAVDGITNNGHGSTTAVANANAPGGFGSDSDSQTKSARWFTFTAPQGGQIVGLRLKFDWSISGNANANDGGGGGVANAGCSVSIEYTTNGGGAWTIAVSDSAFAFAPGGGGDSFSSSGSADIALPAAYPSQGVNQIQVRDFMDGNANANGGEFIGADAQADASITISNIRLEALMQDSRVIAA